MGNSCCIHERITIELREEEEISLDLGTDCVNVDPFENSDSKVVFFNEMSEEVQVSPISSVLIQ